MYDVDILDHMNGRKADFNVTIKLKFPVVVAGW